MSSLRHAAVLSGLLWCTACDKDGDPAVRARRKELCPDLDTWAACATRLDKIATDDRHRLEAQRAAQSTRSTGAPLQEQDAGAPPRPLTASERTHVSKAIAGLESLMRERAGSIVHESEEQCQTRQARSAARVRAAAEIIGASRMGQKTRFSVRPPDLGQDVEGAVNACVMGCLLDDEADRGDKFGRESVARDCKQALVVLSDLGTGLP